MSINPRIPAVAGDLAGVSARLADMDRRLKRATITSGRAAPGSVGPGVIAPGTITAIHIIADAINAGHIQAGSITAGHITAGSINANHIVANAIEAQHINSNTINANHIAAGVITANHIAAGTITATQIAAGTITAQQIAATTITAQQIAAGTITAVQIAAATITADQIAANAIQAGHISAGSVSATHLTANSVIAEKIQANAVTTDKIQAGAVTATKISVATLDAITTNMGSITAGTITGGTIRSGTSGSRWEADPTGFRGYASDGVAKTFEINTGTGIASFTGIATLDANSVVPTSTINGFLSSGNLVPNSSFEQGVNADTGVDQWAEGWQLVNAVHTKNTTLNVHGSNSIQLAAGSDGNMWVGRRDTIANRIRILPNRKYYLSSYVRAATTGRTARMYVYWYDSTNTLISSASGGIITDSTTDWTRITYLTDTAPANAVSLGTIVHFTGVLAGEVHYVDAIQVEPGDVVTAYSPMATEILYSSIRSLFIGAGQVKANNVEAGAIKAQHITLSFGGANVLQNAKFDYWPSGTDPWMWAPYNRGGAGTRTWSKVAAGGPNGENAWRVVLTGTDTFHGFSSQGNFKILPNVTYVSSWWWKGNGQPDIASNTVWAVNEWIENPTTSTTTWQRYSKRLRSTVGGGLSGQTDYWYVYVDSTGVNRDVQVALPQWEQGEFPTAHTPKTDEILPESVGNTQITPNSITAGRMVVGTITAISGIIADAAITNAKIANVDAAKITTGTLDANRIAANSITASMLRVTFPSANKLLNSNFNDHIAGRFSILTQWNGPFETTSGNVAASNGYPGGYACYADANNTGAGAHIYTPWAPVGLFGSDKVSVAIWTHSPNSRVRRIGVQFGNASGGVIATVVSDSASVQYWYRSIVEGVTVAGGAYYTRFYAQILGSTTEQVHWAAAQIEHGEKVSEWALAPGDIVPGSVGETKIEGGAITSDKITANAITGKNFQTSALNPRVAFDSTGFFKTDASGTKAINLGTGSGEGLQLYATTGNGLLPANDIYTVNWKNSNGDIMANIWGTRGTSDIDRGGLWLTARNKVSGGQADVYIGAYGPSSSSRAEMQMVTSGTAVSRGVQVSADSGEGSLWLMRGDGYSDFARADKEVVSRVYGNSEQESANFTTQVEVSPTTGTLRPSITTRRNTVIHVEFSGIVRLLDAAWYRLDNYINMTAGTERDGNTQSPATIHVSNNALSWQTVYISGNFFIPANTTATWRWLMSPVAGTWKYWHGGGYLWGRAHVVGYY